MKDKISAGIVAKLGVGTIAERRFRESIEGVKDLMDADEEEFRRWRRMVFGSVLLRIDVIGGISERICCLKTVMSSLVCLDNGVRETRGRAGALPSI
jgi:hypothetical protein